MLNNNFILLTDYKNENNQLHSYELKNHKRINNINNAKLIIILLLIINANYFYKYYFRNILYRDKYRDSDIRIDLALNDSGSILGNYNLYNLYKYEQITILISKINNWIINDTSILSFINSLQQQTLKDIQIIIILPNDSDSSITNLINENFVKNDNFQIFNYSEKEEFNTNYLMNLIKGKFFMILENFFIFDKKELENIFNLTKGKIDNVFEKKIQNNSFYLFKTKILRNIIDNGYIFNNVTNLINTFLLLPNPQLNYISISMCPNDYYVPLTYVSMISILSSKEEFTFISFYLIISKDFKKKNIHFLLSLYEQFDYFNITFVEMDNRYSKAFISRRMTIQTYFRFSLGELFPNLNRILYLDSDIIAYKDLNKLYNLNFNGKMVLGQVTGYNRNKKTGVYHINNGILLFNLIQMRKMKIEEQVFNIIKKKRKIKVS